MEILSNFASIYCYISFIIGAVLMLTSLAIVAMSKNDESRNKVRFFVTKENNYSSRVLLWLGKPEWDKNSVMWIARSRHVYYICNDYCFEYYKLNPADFADMKEGEIREVFLNLED